MSPRIADDDPVTAEYDVYLTPTQEEQILLLQYPNRNRERPYNDRMGAAPRNMRIKPRTGYVEVDVPLSTAHNFNKLQGLKWGDALRTSKELHNDSGTYGLAAGFVGPRTGASARRAMLKDPAERENALENDLVTFAAAERANKVMAMQTLGGQITRHDGPDDAGKPRYFVGAFRGHELHLTQVGGTAQMRPQFHHVDAEEQRNRIAASREHAAAVAAAETAAGGGASTAAAAAAAAKNDRTLLQQTFKNSNPRGDLDQRQKDMEDFLKIASEEKWVPIEYVDEDAEAAYETYHERLFVRDTQAAEKLKSAMDNDTYLDAISVPREGSPTRRRKRAPRRKSTAGGDDDDRVDEG